MNGRVGAGRLGVLLLVLAPPVQAGELIFRDGAESGALAPGYWQEDGDWLVIQSAIAAHEGDFGIDNTGPSETDGDTLTLSVSSLGYEELELGFGFKVRNGFENTDRFEVLWRPNSSAGWENLITYHDQAASGWLDLSLDLPAAADNQTDLQIQFNTHFNSGGDRIALDPVSLHGQTIVPEPATLVILGAGGLALARRRRKH